MNNKNDTNNNWPLDVYGCICQDNFTEQYVPYPNSNSSLKVHVQYIRVDKVQELIDQARATVVAELTEQLRTKDQIIREIKDIAEIRRLQVLELKLLKG